MHGKIDVTELLNKIKGGDKKAQERLYKYYKKKIDYFLKDTYPNNYDHEDDISEILIKVFKSIDRYDDNKSKFNTWVINIAKNHMIDKSRKQKPLYTTFEVNCSDDYATTTSFTTTETTTLTSLSIPEPMSYYCSPDHNVEITSSINFVSTNMDGNDLSMISMKNSGYNYKEIGLEFDMSESQVSNKINYAKTKMRNMGEE